MLKRRQKVLGEFRHCLVCGRLCQKKTKSGWEIVGDKHTAVPWLGRGGRAPYPDCLDRVLTSDEKASRVKARAQKVWKMRARWKVDKLLQKENKKEMKYLVKL